MSDKFLEPGKKLESVFRELREARSRALESQYQEPVDCISFSRLIRITQADVRATAEETEHLAGCRRCKRFMDLARPNLPVLPPMKKAGAAVDKGTWTSWGIPIMVEPLALRAGSKDRKLGELEPGVYPCTITDRPTRERRARIELRPAGNVVRIRRAKGEAVLIKSTGEPLGTEFQELPANPKQTIEVFLEDVLLFAKAEMEEP